MCALSGVCLHGVLSLAETHGSDQASMTRFGGGGGVDMCTLHDLKTALAP